MASNKELIEMVYDFGMDAAKKNPSIGGAIMGSVPDLLQYDGDLSGITEEELRRYRGLGEMTSNYVARIISGEDKSEVLGSVPAMQRPTRRPAEQQRDDRGNWDGSWDNPVRTAEEG